MNFCRNCGTHLNGEKFCPNCGAGAAPESTAGPAPNTTPAPAPETGEAAVPTAGPGVAANNSAQAVPVGNPGTAPAGTAPNAVPLYANAAPVPGAGFGPTPGMAPPKKRGKLKFVVIGIVILLAAILAVFLLTGKSIEEKMLDQFVAASINRDAEQILDLFPQKMVDYLVMEEYDGDREQCMYALQKEMDEWIYGQEEDNIDMSDISYEIISVENMNEDEIEEVEEMYSELRLRFEEIRLVEVELSYGRDTERGSIGVCKADGDWCVIPLPQ